MWKNAGLALLVTLCVLALGEGAAWLADPQRDDPPPSFGTNHWSFEKKWWLLRKEAQRSDYVDCFFVGSSMVESGIDPETVEQIINSQTGQALNCVEMTVLGASASEIGIVGELLATYYEPSLIVYGMGARDLDDAFGQDTYASVIDIPWVQYWLGNPSFLGWLGHHSEAYGQVMGLVSWYKFSSLDWQYSHPELIEPEQEEDRPRVDFEFDPRLVYLSTLETSEDDLAGLDRLAALRKQGVTVILVEMPVYDGAWEPVFGGYDQYARGFVSVMDDYARQKDMLFVHSTPFTLIGEDDWADWEHMEESGRQVFSEWLGQQIVDGIAEGKITIQTDQYAAD